MMNLDQSLANVARVDGAAGTTGITIILYVIFSFDLKGVTSNLKITSVTNGPNKNIASYKRSPKKDIFAVM